MPGQRRQRGRALRHRLHRRVQDVAQPVYGDADLLEVLEQLRQPQHRLGQLPGDHVEGDQLAHRHLVGDHRLRPKIDDGRRGQRADVLDGVLAQCAELRRLERGLDVGGQPLLPGDLHHRLDRRRLDRLHADHGLHQELLGGGAAVELLLDLVA